jgi:hypothetical protein
MMMNGALLGLIVVAAIGAVLWALLFTGGKLLDIAMARRNLQEKHTLSRLPGSFALVGNSVVGA